MRPLSGEAFFSYFKNESQKQAAREEAEKERIEANVDLIAARAVELGFSSIPRDHMRFALMSKYSEGDVSKAIELIQLQQQAFSGTVLPYNPNVEMLGAVNRSNVTCYLDALLFAMYARLDAFECMLKNDQLHENQRNLAALIRLWVNMLRRGKLIRIDMTERLQEALASCGWQDARLLEQQDTSEAFAFITETLQLPLLTLQVDLFHHGKRDADDHKVVYERLLNLAVPPDPKGKGVKLEDCLEEYFNTRVDVLRDSLVENKSSSTAKTAAMSPGETIRVVSPEQGPNTPRAADDDDSAKSKLTEATVSMESPVSASSIVATDTTSTNSTAMTEASVVSDATEATIIAKGPGSNAKAPATSAPEAGAASNDTALATDGASEGLSAANADSGEIGTVSGNAPNGQATEDTAELAAEPSPKAASKPTTESAFESAIGPAMDDVVTASPVAVSSTDPSSESFDMDPAPVRRWTMLEPHKLTPENRTASSSSDTRAFLNNRQRSTSIIQRIVLEDSQTSTASNSSSLLQQFKRQGSTIIKAVTIPAWQFFRLIRKQSCYFMRQCKSSTNMCTAWHSTSNREPQSDMEVVRQFSKRPVVGICLKRYTMNNTGQFLRQNTYIDIPDSLRLPSFMMGEDGIPRDTDELSAEYKLVLQSVVCHRGVSLHSGHYVSFARVNPKVLTDNRRHDTDPPPDYEEEQWVKFDDLDTANRVSYVSDIKAALKEEMPYLLFYQIVPMVDISPSTTHVNNPSNEPPSYASTTNTAGTPQPSDRPDPNSAAAGYFDSSTWGGSTTTGPSIRFSSELDRPLRFSLDEESTASSSIANAVRKAADGVSRRGSAAFTNSIIGTPVLTPEGGRSPVIAPTDEPTTAQRLSRAAARLTGKSQNRSRPPSQVGEGRMGLTMSRLGGLVRSSKEPLRLPEETSTDASMVTISTAPSAIGSTPALTTVHTAPAATSQEGLQAPDSAAPNAPQASLQPPPQLDGQDDRSPHHHHHHLHHRHHSHAGRKDKDPKESEADGSNAPQPEGTEPTATGALKGKEKERTKVNRMGVPERECTVM